MDNGSIRCWGENEYAQLGDGGGGNDSCGNPDNFEVCRTAPVDVLGLNGKAVIVTAGGRHTCALLEDGRMQCWGTNGTGQTGDGNRWRPSPAYVVGFESPAVLTIEKTVVGTPPETDWKFIGDGEVGAFTLPAVGSSLAFTLAVGTYTITETAQSGYATEVGCTNGTSSLDNSITITLTPGLSIGCTFTNTQQTSTVEGTMPGFRRQRH